MGVLTVGRVSARHTARGLVGAGIGVIRKAIPDEVPDQSADASVEEVLQQDVLDVLRADAASTEDREAALHEEDECARPHKVEGVELRLPGGRL